MRKTTSHGIQPQSYEQPRSLWHNRDFILLWSGQVISLFGTNISAVALPLLMLALTHSPAQAGLLTAMRLLPHLLFNIPAGVLIDRWNRKKVMICCDTVRWLALSTVPLAFVFGYLSIPQLYVVAFIEGTGYVFFSLAQFASLPRVVRPDQLPRAASLSETGDYIASLFGPGLSTFIISLARTIATGAILGYLADSLSYLISALTLCFMRTPFQTERLPVEKQALLKEFGAGWHFLWRQNRLRILLLVTMAVNFLLGPISLTIIVLASGPMHIDVRTLGLILSLNGAGGIVGGIIAPWIKPHLRFGQVIIGSIITWALAAALLAIAGSPFLLIIGGALVWFMCPLYNVYFVPYHLTLVPDELQGRVNSAFRFWTYGSEPLGTAISGLLMASIGPRPVCWLIAAGFALCAILVSCTELRKA